MADNMRASVGNISPEDDLRVSYEGAFTAQEQAGNLDWLSEMAGGADPVDQSPTDPAPVAAETGVEAPQAAAPQSPAYMEAMDEDGSSLLDYAGAALSAIPAVGGDILRGASEAIPQAFGGFVDALGEVDQFMQSVVPIGGARLFDEEGNFSPGLLTNEQMVKDQEAGETLFNMIAPDKADSVTGGIIRAGSQFLTGFLPGLNVARGLKMGTIATGLAAGAIADMVVFDPHEARLSTFLNEVPGLQAIVPDYLAETGKENQTEWEGRLKNAIEGAGLGMIAEGLIKSFKYYKAQREVAPTLEGAGAKAQAAADEQAALARAEIEGEISDDMLRPLGDASDSAPLLIEARPDETLQTSLNRLTEADQRTAYRLEQGHALNEVRRIIDAKKRPDGPKPETPAPSGSTREPIDDALDELRSGAVSKAKLPARPVASIVRDLGGVDPTSSLAGDLRSRGITTRSFPGLYKKGGAQSLDNIPASEHQLFMERGAVNADGYIDQQAFIDGLEAELKGEAWRTVEQEQMFKEIIAPAHELDEQMSRLGIEYENMSNDAVKTRLREITDEQESWIRYQEETASRINAEPGQRTYAELADEQREIWSVEKVAEARAAGVDEAIIRTHEQPKVYINMARINGAEDVKAVIQAMADADARHIKDKTRGVVSNAQTIKESSQEWKDLNDLIGRAPGPMNAAQAVAARRVLASSAEQVTQLAKIAASPNAGKVDTYNFRRALSVHAAIQAEVIGARTETARALQSWAIPAGATKMRTEAVGDLIATYQGGDLAKLAKTMAGLNNEAAINQMARETVGLRTSDALYSVYVNGLLSGPKTHLVNAMSNVAVATYAIPERYAAELFSNAFGKGDIARGEASAMAYGMLEGIRDGVRLMTLGPKAAGMENIGQLWEMFGKQEVRPNPISGGAFGLNPGSTMYRGLDLMGQVVSIPGTFLERGDLFFKSVNYRMELHSLAYREASIEGLEGKAFAEKVADTMMNPPAALVEQANKMALMNTFTNPLGETGRKVQNAIASTPMRWAIPFVRTPTNIMKYSFARTPLAYTMASVRADIAAGGARAAQAHSRVAMSSMLMMTFGGLAMDGNISGGGPLDPAQQAAMRADGWQPYSVKVGGKWFSYSRMDPLGMMLGMSADLAEIANSPAGEEDSDMVFVAAATAFAQNLASKTYAQGAFELAAAIDPRNPMSDPGQFMARQATGLVPFSALLRQTAQAMDPTIRESKDAVVGETGETDAMATYLNGLVNGIKRGIPGMSDSLPPIRDIFGEPMTRESGVGWAWDMVIPIQATTEKNDPVARAIIDNQVKVSRPSRTVAGIQLNAGQYDELQQIAGPMMKEQLAHIVRSPGFNNLTDGPDGMKAQIIKNTVTKVHEHARNMLIMRDPELRDMRNRKMVKNRNLLLGN